MDLPARLLIMLGLLLFLSLHPFIEIAILQLTTALHHIFSYVYLSSCVCIILISTAFLAILTALTAFLLAKDTTIRRPSASSAGWSASTSYTHYDVFINYRVPDLKHALALPLYHSLQSRGLRVFLDQGEMRVGCNIWDQIKAAIGVASVHVVLLSPNYAESAFCLDELVLMVKSGAIIIPVFYDVKPELVSTGENKSGAYDKALGAHEQTHKYDKKRIQSWRDALSHVANISGLELEASNMELLHKVVENVLKFYTREFETGR